MPYFVYTAITREGTVTKGEGEFHSLEDLYYSLQREGLTLIDYSQKRSLGLFLPKGRVTRKELAELLHQLAFMIKSGVPLVTALQDLEGEIKNRRLRDVVSQIKRNILRGETFHSSVAKTKHFPPVVLSLIQIGEASGTLDRTLEEASKHLYRIEEIISQTKRALIYPVFLLLAMTGAFAFWIFYVLPQIIKVFKEMGIKLPTPTIILMNVVNFFMAIKVYIPIVGIALIISFIILYNNKKTQIPVEKFLLKVPIFGRIKRLNFLAFFFEHFALLLSAGIDLLRVLRLMKDSFHRLYYRKIVENLEDRILRGETIAQSMKKENIFSSLDVRMVAVGETTGRLDEQLKMLANFYYDEVKNLIDSLTKILEPTILVIAGIIFMIIIIALIGPIYELITQLGKV